MGSKLNPGTYDCYANALPDEPMFVLLARDPSAPDLLRMWALSREVAVIDGRRPESDRALVGEARECAEAMKAWRLANDGKWRLSLPANPSQLPDGLMGAANIEGVARAIQNFDLSQWLLLMPLTFSVGVPLVFWRAGIIRRRIEKEIADDFKRYGG